MVCVMDIPTLSVSIIEILLWCLVREGGATLVTGLKKACVRSEPLKPNVKPELLLCIIIMKNEDY